MASALFIYAHPDDETFGAAGTICLLRSKEWRVVLACATLGDKGKCGDPPMCAQEDLASVRERELRDAACVLDISAIHLLGYKDKELAAAPPDEIRRKLVALIRAETPEIVCTFDPNGFNVHPDHVAISRFTSDAVAAAADPRWHPDLGPAHEVSNLLWTTPLEPWQEASAHVQDEAGVDVVLDVSLWAEKKEAALRAHRTQHKSVEHHFFSKPNLKEILSVETWRSAWPGQKQLMKIFSMLLVAVIGLASPVFAQATPAVTLAAGAGVIDADLPGGGTHPVFSLRATRRLPGHFAIEGGLAHTEVDRQFGRFPLTAFELQLQYHVPAGRFTPYFGAGGGLVRDGSEVPGDNLYPLSLEGWNPSISVAGGTRVRLTDRLDVFGELRYRGVDVDFRGRTIDATAGLALKFY